MESDREKKEEDIRRGKSIIGAFAFMAFLVFVGLTMLKLALWYAHLIRLY